MRSAATIVTGTHAFRIPGQAPHTRGIVVTRDEADAAPASQVGGEPVRNDAPPEYPESLSFDRGR